MQNVTKMEDLTTNADELSNSDRTVGSVTYHDLAANYTLGDDLTFYVNINNAFDKGPAKPWFTGTGEFSSIYDNLGRFYSAGFTYKF
jgi:outer membrane receptor protein involved in Fe transport